MQHLACGFGLRDRSRSTSTIAESAAESDWSWRYTANRRYASRLKAEIESRIARAEFNYAEFFPDSPRARTLSRRAGDAIIVREVLRRYIDTAERSLERSTWLDYRRSWSATIILAGVLPHEEMLPLLGCRFLLD